MPRAHEQPASAEVYRRSPPVTIRWAAPTDAESLRLLAELDEAPVPAAPVLVAAVDGELWAALSLSSEAMICDPFRPSAEVAVLLRERGRQLTVRRRSEPRLALLRPRRRSSAKTSGAGQTIRPVGPSRSPTR